MIRITDTVKHLIIINVIVFLGMMLLQNVDLQLIEKYFILHHPASPYFKPVQLVTNIFAHANTSHIFFNMLVLFFLGPMVEAALGPKRFLTMYLSAGILAGLIQVLVTSGGVLGASGATMGVTAAFAGMFPNMRLMLLFPPIPIKAKYLALIIIAIDAFSGFSGMSTGVGHFAHLAGAAIGFFLIVLWGKLNLR